jgi:hypothetical protein
MLRLAAKKTSRIGHQSYCFIHTKSGLCLDHQQQQQTASLALPGTLSAASTLAMLPDALFLP